MALLRPSSGVAAVMLIGTSIAGADAALASPKAPSTPATYLIEALTTAGMGPGGSGMAMMQQLMGGRAPEATRSLDLTLRSTQLAPASPQAEHRIPAGLGLGASLPLLTPEPGSDRPPQDPDHAPTETVKGRLLIFRGCAETAPTGQPEVIELAQLLPDQRRLAESLAKPKGQQLGQRPTREPAITIGTWPHGDKDSDRLPAAASLVGDHQVRSNYAPEIAFKVDAAHDFLAPVQLNNRRVAGAMELSWSTVPTALGYQATVSGSGQQEGDLVIWTSSTAAWAASSVPPDLTATTARKLVDQGVLLPPSQSRCSVSAQAMNQMGGMGFLNFQAFGDTLKLAGPSWSLTLQRQSILLQPLMEMPMAEESPPSRGSGFGWIPGLF